MEKKEESDGQREKKDEEGFFKKEPEEKAGAESKDQEEGRFLLSWGGFGFRPVRLSFCDAVAKFLKHALSPSSGRDSSEGRTGEARKRGQVRSRRRNRVLS